MRECARPYSIGSEITTNTHLCSPLLGHSSRGNPELSTTPPLPPPRIPLSSPVRFHFVFRCHCHRPPRLCNPPSPHPPLLPPSHPRFNNSSYPKRQPPSSPWVGYRICLHHFLVFGKSLRATGIIQLHFSMILECVGMQESICFLLIEMQTHSI